jgi:hypothetical protein
MSHLTYKVFNLNSSKQSETFYSLDGFQQQEKTYSGNQCAFIPYAFKTFGFLAQKIVDF